MSRPPLLRAIGRVRASAALAERAQGTGREHAARESLRDAQRTLDLHLRGCPAPAHGVDRLDFVTGTVIGRLADRRPPARRRGSTRQRRTLRRRRIRPTRAGPDDGPGEPEPALPGRGWCG